MPRFTPEWIEELKSRADIVATIHRFVPLHRSGARWVGLCPFHDDHSPSLYVNPQMGRYKCFACGASGDVIKFLQEHEKLEFTEALEWLARETGMALPAAESGPDEVHREERGRAMAAHEEAALWFQEQLKNAPVANQYINSRGLTPESVSRFRLGWAPREGLIAHLVRKGYSPADLVHFGLARERDGGGIMELFRERLMFPICANSGKVIAFGGRTLLAAKEHNIPKYVNSPESPIYQKSEVMYGFHLARAATSHSKSLILVEGYLDVIQLHQAGITHVVAVSGTALTDTHARIVSRHVDKAILVFDGDAAGRKAARRSLEMLIPFGLTLEVLLLPEGEDPDSLVRTGGAEAFLSRLPSAKGTIEYMAGPADGAAPEVRSSILAETAALLGKIRDPIRREEFLQAASKRFGTRTELLGKIAVESQRSRFHRHEDPEKAAPPPSLPPKEARFLAMCLSQPAVLGLVGRLLQQEDLSDLSLAEILEHAITLFEEKGEPGMRLLFDRIPLRLQDVLQRLPEDQWNPNSAQREALDSMLEFALRRLGDASRRLQSGMSGAEGNTSLLAHFQSGLRLRKALLQCKKEIAGHLGDAEDFVEEVHTLRSQLEQWLDSLPPPEIL